MIVENNGMIRDRVLKFFTSVSDPEWGYTNEQRDTFAVEYPKNYDETKSYPLYVVFHSAGHGIYSTIECLYNKGNHDIYHTPDDMFGLFLDCRTNSDNDNDWWWGGSNPLDPNESPARHEGKQPVEHRSIATVEWVMDNYPIDRERVYGVGNSMGGTGVLGVCLCRGDIFAAIKANVPAGVRHAADRCCLDTDAPDGFTIPDPPVVVDYSAQNDMWSTGHEILYKGMREKKYALHGYWGAFGHENNNHNIAIHNDLVHSLPVFEIKKNEAYPVFTNADTDDNNPWEFPEANAVTGQVNGFFRWENVTDTEDALEMKLWMLTPEEFKTRVKLPEKACADLLLRRVQNFKLQPGESFKWTLGEVSGTSVADEKGYPVIEGVKISQSAKVLKLSK